MPNLRLKRKKRWCISFSTLIKALSYDICNKITTKRVMKNIRINLLIKLGFETIPTNRLNDLSFIENTHLLRITI